MKGTTKLSLSMDSRLHLLSYTHFKSEVRHETYSANQFGFPIFLKGSAKVCKQVFRRKMIFSRKKSFIFRQLFYNQIIMDIVD